MPRRVDPRWIVPAAAVAVVAIRMVGLLRPVRPDEAGFLLVARSWQPQPESLYGHYFVDRPPPLIAVVRLADWLGGATALRILGALGCAVAVLVAARIGTLVATEVAGRWSAVAVAALTCNPLIDTVAVKGELLALPLSMAAIWWALLAVRAAGHWRALGLAVLAGVAGASALGMKQNLAGALVLAGVLFVGTWWWQRTGRRRLVALVGGLALGAAVPVAATLAWAGAAGVRLEVLAYAVYGFRSDASRVLASYTSAANYERLGILLAVALGAGVVVVLGGFVVHLRGEWHADRPTATAAGALVLVELASLVASGSYWRDYLFPLVPAVALVVALMTQRPTVPGRRMRLAVGFSAVSAAVSLVVWGGLEAAHVIGYTEAETGEAVAEVAAPGDTLTVFGGRADLQYAAGLDSPYSHLWSLPMRTLDPEYAELRSLLEGPEAPTWFVAWVGFGAWDNPAGAGLAATVEERYALHGIACGDRPVFLLRGVERAPLTPECS